MEKANEEEKFEDCIEEKKVEVEKEAKEDTTNKTEEKQEKVEENSKTEEKEEKEENKNQDNNKNEDNKDKEEEDETTSNKKEEYIPYTMAKAQKKGESGFPEKDKNDSEDEEEEKVEKIELSEQEKKNIEEKIINERKNAGDLYKNKEYIQALNIYSLLLKDAKRADLKEQCCILNCNKGICFNKLNDYDKALESFKEALRYNKDYSKALCNKMLLLNKKEEYMEAYEDFKRLRTLDYNLWENYRNMENGLAYQAEIQKKKMTSEMLGKLKDVGNSILGKFGLSLDNFQMTPNGQGGYSIQYNNNK
jgi:tetratricopeptide (TPR) repeat protein